MLVDIIAVFFPLNWNFVPFFKTVKEHHNNNHENKKKKKCLTWKNRNVTVPETDRVFLFFFHWNIDMKKDKIKYNHRYPTRSLSMPCSSCQSSLQSHGQLEVLSQNYSTVPIQAVHCVPYVSPHCSVCPAASEGQEEQGLGSQVPLFCRLRWQTRNEQPLALAMSLDANTAQVFPQWLFPLDIATARSSPISFIFLFFLKSHFP